jgi:hypothetical protein
MPVNGIGVRRAVERPSSRASVTHVRSGDYGPMAVTVRRWRRQFADGELTVLPPAPRLSSARMLSEECRRTLGALVQARAPDLPIRPGETSGIVSTQ